MSTNPGNSSSSTSYLLSKKAQPFNGNWRALGFHVAPRTNAEAELCMAAKECLERCANFSRIKEMLYEGAKPRDIAWWLQEEKGECRKLAPGTLVKYITTYRRCVLVPLESRVEQMELEVKKLEGGENEEGPAKEGVKKGSTETRPWGASAMMGKMLNPLVERVMEVAHGVSEAALMEEALRMQIERIRGARGAEIKLNGFLMPGLRGELEILTKMCRASQEMKSDLGVPGYERAPSTLDVKLRKGIEPVDWGAMTEAERQHVASFASEVLTLIDLSPGKPGEPQTMPVYGVPDEEK